MVTAGSQTQAAEQTFTGVINADQVNIRSGASTNHYPVMKLKRGATVVVHKAKVAGAKANQWDLYGWYQITPPAGSFSHVSKKFVTLDGNGKTAVVSGNRVMVRAPAPTDPNASYKVQMSVNRGEYAAIVGASGSGKSTLLSILGCLDRPGQGTYRLAGHDVLSLRDNKLSELRLREIGFVFQSFQLIPQLSIAMGRASDSGR